MITVKLKVQEEKKESRNKHPHITQNKIIIILILAFVVFNPGDLYYLGYKK